MSYYIGIVAYLYDHFIIEGIETLGISIELLWHNYFICKICATILRAETWKTVSSLRQKDSNMSPFWEVIKARVVVFLGFTFLREKFQQVTPFLLPFQLDFLYTLLRCWMTMFQNETLLLRVPTVNRIDKYLRILSGKFALYYGTKHFGSHRFLRVGTFEELKLFKYIQK